MNDAPAFPCHTNPLPGKLANAPQGMTKREYFAAAAMQGMMANPDEERNYQIAADICVKQADALLDRLAVIEAEFTVKPQFWCAPVGALMCDRAIDGVTQDLRNEGPGPDDGTESSEEFYGGRYMVGETIGPTAAKRIAEALGGEWCDTPPQG